MKAIVICFVVMLGIGIAGYNDGREQLMQQAVSDSYKAGLAEGRRLQAAADRNRACSLQEYLSRLPSKQ